MLNLVPLSVLEKTSVDKERFLDRYWQKTTSEIDFVNNSNSHWIHMVGAKYNHTTEKLFFNTSSLKMLALKEKALKACKGETIEVVLATVNELINQITDQNGRTRRDVEKTLDRKLIDFNLRKKRTLPAKQRPNITMDEYIDAKLLICRHKGLIAAGILSHLVEKGVLPQGKVRYYRSTLTTVYGKHAWAMYRDCTSGKLWICDPRWETAKNVTDDYAKLIAKGYGNIELNDMNIRLDILDVLNPFKDKLNIHKNHYKFNNISIHKELSEQNLRIDFGHDRLTYLNCLALSRALHNQGVLNEVIDKRTHFVGSLAITISANNNPGLFKTDFARLLHDYKQINIELLTQEHNRSNKRRCEYFIGGIKKYSLVPINPADIRIHPGSKSTPGMHVRIELKRDNVNAKEAIFFALRQQGVLFEEKEHGNPFIAIPAPKIRENKLNFEQLYNDYWIHFHKLNEQHSDEHRRRYKI